MNDNLSFALLARIIEEGYRRKAWQGPNLKGSLRLVTSADAAWRPGPGRHNIWEIAVHAAYWKYAVRRKILGERPGSFALKGSNRLKRVESQKSKSEAVLTFDF